MWLKVSLLKPPTVGFNLIKTDKLKVTNYTFDNKMSLKNYHYGLLLVHLYDKPKYIFISFKILGGGRLIHYDCYLRGILGIKKKHILNLISPVMTSNPRIP